jgi:hypothetical protein
MCQRRPKIVNEVSKAIDATLRVGECEFYKQDSSVKYLIPVLAGGATITAAITTAVAQAHGALSGQSSLKPYLVGYGAAIVLLAIAGVIALNSHRQESPSSGGGLKFVLDVVGTQPLSSQLSDWRFLLQNCGSQTVRYVQLGAIRSEIGAYELDFKIIPALLAGEKAVVQYQVYPRRDDERYSGKNATLWDFGKDHAGERGHTFIWYDIPVQYRDADDSIREAGIVSVCFDLDKQILKTEGVEFWNESKRTRRSLL